MKYTSSAYGGLKINGVEKLVKMARGGITFTTFWQTAQMRNRATFKKYLQYCLDRKLIVLMDSYRDRKRRKVEAKYKTTQLGFELLEILASVRDD